MFTQKIILNIASLFCILPCFGMKKRNLTELPLHEFTYRVRYFDQNYPVFDKLDPLKQKTYIPYKSNPRRIGRESYRILKKFSYRHLRELIQEPTGKFLPVLTPTLIIYKYHYDKEGNFINKTDSGITFL